MAGGGSEADPATVAREQALANRINTYSPFGQVEFVTDRGGPNYTPSSATITLDPAVEDIVRQQLMASALTGRRGVQLLNELPATADASRQRVEQAVFDRATSLLNPELDRREDALRQRLANQGLPQASRAFESELGRFERGSNQALEQAALSAVLAGGAEETRRQNIIAQLLGLTIAPEPAAFAPGQVTIPVGGGGGISPLAGGLSGAASGAATGATIGSAFPGYGTAIGGIAGALIGGLGGYGATAR